MKGKDKSDLNQIFLILLAPPFFLLIVNIIASITGIGIGDRFFIEEGKYFVNVHQYWWTILWVIPYVILYFFRHNKTTWPITKLAICLTLAVAVVDHFAKYYDWIYLLLVSGITAYSFWFLNKNEFTKEKLEYGAYPMTLDLAKRKLIPTHFFNENTQIIGSTGSGKTHYVIKPLIEQTIQQGLGCFVLDVKSNLYKDVIFYAEEANRPEDIRYIDLAHPEFSNTYNPLYGDNPDEIANRVYTALYCDYAGEPFYKELASAFLTNLVGLLMTEIRTITFQDLATATGELGTFQSISDLCARHPESRHAQYFQDLWLGMPIRERQTALTGLLNKLQRFCNREWSPLINSKNPDIRMGDVLSRGEIFILGTHAMKYSEDAKPLAVMTMMDLSSQIADRFMYPTEKPFRVFLDEFFNIAYPGFINLINKCRETKVNLFLAHQSLGDLVGVSREFKEQVMNTARNKVILGVDDPDTAEHFSRLLGTEPDLDARVVSYDANDNVAGISVPQVEKFKFHPNEIKELSVGEAIIRLVPKNGTYTFRTTLGTATPLPDGFYPYGGRYESDIKMRKNETSLNPTPRPPVADKKEEDMTSMIKG